MAQTKSVKFALPKMQQVRGGLIAINDRIAPTANPAASDTWDFMLPKGIEYVSIKLIVPQFDSNGTPTLTAKIGFQSLTGGSTYIMNGVATSVDDAYFQATGAWGRVAQAYQDLLLKDGPLVFEEDVYLRFTIGATCATYVASKLLHMMAVGNMQGVK
jgi:hypothetical protein